jgi:hypothetical protein
MAAAAILENATRPSMLSFLDSACCHQSVYRFFSESDEKWTRYNRLSLFNMAVAAISENGIRPSMLIFLESACHN